MHSRGVHIMGKRTIKQRLTLGGSSQKSDFRRLPPSRLNVEAEVGGSWRKFQIVRLPPKQTQKSCKVYTNLALIHCFMELPYSNLPKKLLPSLYVTTSRSTGAQTPLRTLRTTGCCGCLSIPNFRKSGNDATVDTKVRSTLDQRVRVNPPKAVISNILKHESKAEVGGSLGVANAPKTSASSASCWVVRSDDPSVKQAIHNNAATSREKGERDGAFR